MMPVPFYVDEEDLNDHEHMVKRVRFEKIGMTAVMMMIVMMMMMMDG